MTEQECELDPPQMLAETKARGAWAFTTEFSDHWETQRIIKKKE